MINRCIGGDLYIQSTKRYIRAKDNVKCSDIRIYEKSKIKGCYVKNFYTWVNCPSRTYRNNLIKSALLKYNGVQKNNCYK